MNFRDPSGLATSTEYPLAAALETQSLTAIEGLVAADECVINFVGSWIVTQEIDTISLGICLVQVVYDNLEQRYGGDGGRGGGSKDGGFGKNGFGDREVNNFAGRRSVVIGEGMDAIKETARKRGAKWYQAWSKFFSKENFDLEKSLERNKRWIERKIEEGYDFYDIGIDPSRDRRSPFYQLEKSVLEEHGYPITPIGRP